MENYVLSKYFSAGENKIGSSGGFGKFTNHFETYDFGKYHANILSHHNGFSLDSSDTPTTNSQTIDHGGVRISSNLDLTSILNGLRKNFKKILGNQGIRHYLC